ncbi:Hsp20/alpha crystallin family protein [Candidatus Uhrbacteria bacterium]|nr:Hsp20/alpha crystallin family protein [Candidatus Uhrbacteria bacterium]
MSLIKWSPFFEPFEMDKFFEGMVPTASRQSGLVPAIDIYEKNNAVMIETALPGVNPKNVELSVENGVLIIKGDSERKTEIDEKDYYRKEIRSGSFMRQVALPEGILQDHAKAGFKDGILLIEFPKADSKQAKSIKIDIESNKE